MRASILVGDPATARELQSCLERQKVTTRKRCRRPASMGAWVEEVRSARPDLIFIDPSTLGVNLESAVAVVSAAAPRATVAVVGSSLDPSRMIEALRAGARDYVAPPLESSVMQVVRRKRLVC
jgi:DNA-binding NarL/FixJ family response regulator